MKDIDQVINSLKGISGSGDVLAEFIRRLSEEGALTMEPGDYAGKDVVMAAPIGYDLWYLWYADNFLLHYFKNGETTLIDDPRHYDYSDYLASKMSFLPSGLKPLKVLTDLEQLSVSERRDVFDRVLQVEWANNGIFWINTMAFEVWQTGLGMQYASDGPKNFSPNDYAGYITFPVGQLGVMEVISIIRETRLSGYRFCGEEIKQTDTLNDEEKPAFTTPPEIFPPRVGGGESKGYGYHLIDKGYLIPDESKDGLPAAIRDVELFSSDMEKYTEKVQPKKWMRYWLHKDSAFVPGEFVGILCKPVVAPPHVWWFQESSPFLYAGNWVETWNLTSGVVTEVTLEEDRTDGQIGNQYKIKIQGCEVNIEASDFLLYSVGDRVAVLKMDSIETVPTKSFTWLDQTAFNKTDEEEAAEGQAITNYVIIPAVFIAE
jgi:hypothetical protein